MLTHDPMKDGTDDAYLVTHQAEEARPLARLHIKGQQRVDARRCNLRRRDVEF